MTNDEREERVMERVKEYAESIDNSLKVTTDRCSNYEDGRLPILDVRVWLGKNERGENKILHCHYMKDVTSRAVVNAISAHSQIVKRNVMVNEIGRILKNCSVELKWEEIAGHVEYFMRRMQYSCYTEEFRYEVLRRALKKYDERVARYRRSGSMFGRENENNGNRRERNKREWYNKSREYETVMFVEPTPESVLKRKIQEVAKRNKVKVKVVERVGMTVKGLLQKSVPFDRMKCGRRDCMVCESNKDVDCRTRGCVYELKCKQHIHKYDGQTGRSIYERTKEEAREWEKKSDKSPLWKHSLEFHEGEKFEIDVKVRAKCFGRPAKRMITEAVLIEELEEGETMNNRKEWSYVRLKKI